MRTQRKEIVPCKTGGVFEAAKEIVVEIVSGEGGDDSKMFAAELASAYERYAKSAGLGVEVLAARDGHVRLGVTGESPWAMFRHEPGRHVCQRVPATESRGRVHTSLVSVAVMSARPIPSPLREEDIEVETCGGHGPGGQHQNKTDSAVRMRHVPTGIVVFINGRSQHANRREARRVLVARVASAAREQAEKRQSEGRLAQTGGGRRGDKVRTYNFANGRVTDHRLGRKTRQIGRVMKGDFRLILGD